MISTPRIRILTLALLLFVLAPAISQAEYSAVEANEIWSFYTENPWGPVASTDGVTVVWNENNVAVGSGEFTFAAIAAARPGKAGRFEVVRNDDGDIRFHSPAVGGDFVVWVQTPVAGEHLDSGEIWVGDLGTGTVRQIAEVEGVWRINPQVDGDWVVWKTHAESAAILAYNLRSNEEVVVVLSGAQDFSVDDGYVVWKTNRSSVTYDPYTAFLSKHLLHLDDEPVVLAEDLDYVQWDYRDGTLVYRSYAPRQNYPDAALELGIVNVETGDFKQVVIPHPHGSTEWILTNGRYIFGAYAESYSDSPVPSLITYDTWTESSYITVAPRVLQSGFWTVPAVEGDLFAWASHDNPWEVQLATVHAKPVTTFLPTAPVAATVPPGVDYVWFAETEHALQGVFKSYWDSNGGLPMFGYPLTAEFTERNADTGETYVVQFTERQRFEWHPENLGTPYQVLLGRLGSELLTLQGRDWTLFPKADPDTSHYFVETGHAIAPEFWDYWSNHGLEFGDPGVTFRESLALFGYPLSQPLIETNSDGHTVLTQYFERTVFEYHPDNHDPYKVLLRRLGAEMLVERGWMDAPNADQERIAFVSAQDGNAEIYVINADGTGIQNLTSHSGNDTNPQWSPDGTRILFMSDRSGGSSLYVMDADGSNVIHLTPEPGTYSAPMWSPDGSHIAYTAYTDGTLYESSHLHVVRVSDAYSWQVSEHPWVTSLTWAPDGTRIAYATSMYRSITEEEQDSVIHVVNVDDTGDVPLTLDLPHATNPVWSPDGSRIAFFQGGIASGMPWLESLQIMDPDGTIRLALATCGDGNRPTCYGASWSPDSRMLAFHRDNTRLDMGDSEILLVNADGSGQRVIYTGDLLSTPSWSSDGTRIVFSAGDNIVVASVDGSEISIITQGGSPTLTSR